MTPGDDAATDSAIARLAERLASLDDVFAGHASGRLPAPSGAETRGLGPAGQVPPDDLDVLLLLNQAGAEHRRELSGQSGPTPAKIGRFRLIREVGSGGFAFVYEAIDGRLRRRVALKVARANGVLSPSALRRFVREAELAARVVHPQVVSIHEVGHEDGVAFIAEEFCDGGSLEEWLAEHPGPVDPRIAAAAVRSIAEGIHAAHGCGITHRDIKPANVLLATAGSEARALLPRVGSVGLDVKIGDFGLGTLAADAMIADQLSQLSTEADRVGTLAWMAPEQVDRSIDPVGPRTDVYALGLLLDRMLTGRCRQSAGSEAETLRLILMQPPEPADRLVPGVPADLGAVCLKCLAKNPRDRYASAAEFAVDLSRFLDGRPTLARPLGPLGRSLRAARRQPLLTASVAATIAAVLLGGGLWLDSSGKRQEIRSREAALRTHEAVGELRTAFESLRNGDVAGSVRHLRSCRSIDATLADSLAGRWLLRRSRGERRTLLDLSIERPSASGSPPTDLYVLAVSPDGSRLAAGRADGTLSIAPWPDDGGTPRWLHLPAHDEINDVAFSPDGSLVATAGQDGAVHVWSSVDGKLVGSPRLVGSPLYAVAFSPDGTRIAWGGEERRILLADSRSGVVADPLTPFDAPSPPAGADDGEIESLVWIDEARIAAACGRRVVMVRVADGGVEREFAGLRGIIGHLDLSPDRRRMLCAGTSTDPSVVDVETGVLSVRLATHPNWVQGGVFAPDGATITTGCKDGVIRQFDALTGELLGAFVGHVGRLWDVRFGPANRLVSAGADGTLREWDLAVTPASRGALVATLPSGEIADAAIWQGPTDFLPDLPEGERVALLLPRAGETLAVSLPSGVAMGWRGPAVGDGRKMSVLPPRVAVFDHHVLRIDSLEGEGSGSAPPIDNSWASAWLPDGRLVVGAWSGEVRLFDESLGSSRLIDRFERGVECIAVGGPRRDRLAVGSGGEIRVHAIGASPSGGPAMGTPLLTPPLIADVVTTVAWSPDAMQIAYGTNHGTVRIVDATTGAPRGAFATHLGEVRRVRFSRDGRIIVSCDAESVRISDVQTAVVLDEIRPGWTIGAFDLATDPSGAIDDGILLVGGVRPPTGRGDGRLLWLDLSPHRLR